MGRRRFTVLIICFILSLGLQGQRKYELPASHRLQTGSLELLRSYVGTSERTGRNDGKLFYRIQKHIGIAKGDAYCMALQYWCFDSVAHKINEKNPLPRNALAQSAYNHARRYGKKTKYFAEIGDLVVWRRGKSSFGHIERVEKVLSGGWVITIAGNVHKGKKQGIYRKKRNIFNPLSRILHIKGLVGFNEIKE